MDYVTALLYLARLPLQQRLSVHVMIDLYLLPVSHRSTRPEEQALSCPRGRTTIEQREKDCSYVPVATGIHKEWYTYLVHKQEKVSVASVEMCWKRNA